MLHFNATTFLRERICEFVFQDGVRFYIYFDSDYELDADSVEEKNKVRPNLVFDWNALTLLPHQCIYEFWYICCMGYMYEIPICELHRLRCVWPGWEIEFIWWCERMIIALSTFV